MKLTKIETGNFMLDGGALFGVVPKSLWNTVYPSNSDNLCNLSMRCLLIETDDRKILIDTGIGNKQDNNFFRHYYLNGNENLHSSLSKSGYALEDITDVILTHLHFDHCGGAIKLNLSGTTSLTFPNAIYWVSELQWKWAMMPNRREKASYLKENFIPIRDTNKLNLVSKEGPLFNNIEIRFFNGHSEGLMVPFIRYNNRILVYVSDLIPTSAHLPEAWVCGYDTRPLVSMEERKNFYKEALQKNYVLFFEHDINIECCTLKDTEKGTRLNESFTLREFLDIK